MNILEYFKVQSVRDLLFLFLYTSNCLCTAIIEENEWSINNGVDVRLNDPEDDEGMVDSYFKDGFVDHLTAPGCPQRTFNMPWVYYGEPARCYLAGTRGPCPPMMKLFLKSDLNHTGICDCEDAGQYTKKELQLISKKKDFCIKETRNLAYFLPKNRCYPLFDRGPCPMGYWLVLKKGKRTVCEKRRCHQNLLDPSDYRVPFWFFDPFMKSCFQAYTQGYCPVSYMLFPTKQSHLPKCVNVNVRCGGIFPFSSDIPVARCGAGSFAKSLANCKSEKVSTSMVKEIDTIT